VDPSLGQNGGVTFAILLYFLGMGAAGLGVLGIFVVLVAMMEHQAQVMFGVH
jgi:hypothetical protein